MITSFSFDPSDGFDVGVNEAVRTGMASSILTQRSRWTFWRRGAATLPVWYWGSLLLIAATLCLNHLGDYRPLTQHEVYVAQTAREMYISGDWLCPTYMSQPRYQKPPLAYWGTAICFSCVGVSEVSARLPAALTGIAFTILLAFAVGRRYGNVVGWTAGFIQTTSVYFLMQARLAEADITVALAVAAALLCYGELAVPLAGARPTLFRKIWASCGLAFGFWLSAAIAALAKGPIGPVMIAVAVLMHSGLRGERTGLRQLFTPLPILLFFLLVFTWPAGILWRDPSVAEVWLRESAGRFLKDPNDVVRHPFYYPLAALWLTLPWTPFWIGLGIRSLVLRWRATGSVPNHLKRALSFLRQGGDFLRSTGQGFETLLLVWFLAPMALLSLSAGKQEHYLIPALAPCCVWGALGLRRWQTTFVPRPLTLDRRAYAIALLLIGILLTQSLLLPWVHGRRTYAEWIAEGTSRNGGAPAVVVGHSVQWLTFYSRIPLERCDTLEELFRREWKGDTLVVATQGDAAAIAARFPVVSREVAPWDGRSSEAKRPTLLRIGPSVRPLAN